jgi:hypothetical protein
MFDAFWWPWRRDHADGETAAAGGDAIRWVAGKRVDPAAGAGQDLSA